LLLLATAPLIAAKARALEGAAAPTIVLVHGAWADETGWNDVVARLQKDGYHTATPRIGVTDPTADVATVRATLDEIAGPKILVGHSYGGYVVTNVASGRTDVQALVYTAAFTPDEGDTLQSLGAGYAPPAAFEHFVWTGEPFASLAYIDPVWFRHDFAQDLNPKAAAEMSDHQQPIAVPILTTPSGPAAWHTIPSWFAISGADRMIDPALQRAEAIRIGATTVVFDDASQDATYELAMGLKTLRQLDKLQVLTHPKNLGYGGNQKAGYRYFMENGFDVVVLLHGDGQYAPEILSHLYHPIVAGEADAVFGSRMMKTYGGPLKGGMPLYKYLGNRVLSTFENRMLGMQLTEFQKKRNMQSGRAAAH